MPRSRSTRLLMTIALAALSSAPAVAKDRKPDGLVATGKTVDCIPLSAIRSTDVRDDQTIDFVLNGNKVYRNTLPNKCPSLGFERRFSYRTSLSQLCSVDIITVLFSAGPGLQPGSSCGLGKFQPMTKATK